LKTLDEGLNKDVGMLETARVTTESFETFIAATEPRLRRAFVARFGVEHGNDVTADVVAYAWEHWETMANTVNPVGYLYRVGQSRARRYRRWARPLAFPMEPSLPGLHVEPGLGAALGRLSNDQRVAVILVHSYGWTYAEAAGALGIPISTFRNHLHRGMTRLRTLLEAK
jgi:DNA-directed RNA polymerase specialized sigma24 family protein